MRILLKFYNFFYIFTDNFKTMAKEKKFIPMKNLGKSHTKEHLKRFFPFLVKEFRKIESDELQSEETFRELFGEEKLDFNKLKVIFEFQK